MCSVLLNAQETLTFIGIQAAQEVVARIYTEMVATAMFPAKPAATPQGSQTGVCGDEKVSQTPSGGWSVFDTQPVTQPHSPHTQMDNISGQIASGQTIAFNNVFFYLLIYSEACSTKQLDCSVEKNNATFDHMRRTAAC